MAIVSQGNSVVIDVDATSAIWVKSTGNAEVTVNRGGTPEVSNVTTDVGRFGYYGEPFQLTIRSVTGQAEYQDQQLSIQPLTSTQMGGLANSSATDIALAVNPASEFVNSQKTFATNLPYTQFVPSENFAYTVVSGSPTVTEEIAPNGKVGLKISASAFCAIAVTNMSGVQYDGDMYVSIYGTQSLTNLGTVDVNAYFGAGTANYRRGRRSILPTSPVEDSTLEQGGALTYHFNAGNTTTIGTIATPTSFEMSQMRINFNPAVAGPFTVWLFAVGIGQQRKRGRICVMYDDGYTSSYRLGHPVWKKVGVPQTMAVIATEVGKNSTYMTADDLRVWNASGNSCVAHGPDGGAGSLVIKYASQPEWPLNAVADIRKNVQFLIDNGLAKDNDRHCYVYPQGDFQRFPNDTSLLDAIHDDGLVNAARAATIMPISQRPFIYNQDAVSKYQRLAMPRIGHKWAGTTAAEATNISNLVLMIQECALYGLDFFLVFHQVKPSATPDNEMGEIDIRVSDMATLANAVKAEIDAGRLEAIHMRDFVAFDTVYSNY